MPYEAAFFDAMSSVTKLINFMPATNVVIFLQTGLVDDALCIHKNLFMNIITINMHDVGL